MLALFGRKNFFIEYSYMHVMRRNLPLSVNCRPLDGETHVTENIKFRTACVVIIDQKVGYGRRRLSVSLSGRNRAGAVGCDLLKRNLMAAAKHWHAAAKAPPVATTRDIE